MGTPDYIPPEVINGVSISNKTIDWWSLGIILYEMICGIPPFNDNSVENIFHNILNRAIVWPPIGEGDDCMSSECKDLIEKLLDMNHKTRLGANGA